MRGSSGGNTSTGEYTAPEDGAYHVSTGVSTVGDSVATGDELRLAIAQNGTAVLKRAGCVG